MQPQSTHAHKFAQAKLVKIVTVQVELCMSVSRVGPLLLAPRVGLCAAWPGWWAGPCLHCFPGDWWVWGVDRGGSGHLWLPALFARPVFKAHPSAPCFALFRPAGPPAPLRFSGDRPCGARPVATHVTALSLPPHPCPRPTPVPTHSRTDGGASLVWFSALQVGLHSLSLLWVWTAQHFLLSPKHTLELRGTC